MRKPGGMSVAGQGTCPVGLNNITCLLLEYTKAEARGKPGWAKPQYPPVSARAGDGPHQAGPLHTPEQ